MNNETRNQLFIDLHALKSQPEIGQDARSRIQHLLDSFRIELQNSGQLGQIVILDRLSTQDAILYALSRTRIE